MWEAIAGLISIAAVILRYYLQAKTKKKVDTYEKDVANMDRAIANRDADSISILFDKLRKPPNPCDTGRQDDKTSA